MQASRGHQGRQDPRSLRSNVLADHGAFNATAQPSKYPAGFFDIFTGSYDLQAAHCKVTGVYTNKAPGGVAYACSFRVTEAVYLVERMVDVLARKLEMDPAEPRLKHFIQPDQFPTPTRPAGIRLRQLRAAMRLAHGDGRLRRPAARAGGEARPRRADGHRRRLLHRDRGCRTAQAHGHRRPWDGRRRRMRVHPTGKAVVRISVQTQGKDTRRRSPRSWRRRSASRRRTSRSFTATPTRPRSGSAPTAAGQHR